jgi:four helix bundle protein
MSSPVFTMSEQPKDLKPRTKAFALRVIRMYSKLPKNDTVAQVLGRQVLRSGTSVGANYREASRARSKAEFISKIGDCLKEIEETEPCVLRRELPARAELRKGEV